MRARKNDAQPAHRAQTTHIVLFMIRRCNATPYREWADGPLGRNNLYEQNPQRHRRVPCRARHCPAVDKEEINMLSQRASAARPYTSDISAFCIIISHFFVARRVILAAWKNSLMGANGIRPMVYLRLRQPAPEYYSGPSAHSYRRRVPLAAPRKTPRKNHTINPKQIFLHSAL